jgi:hypothetical protein
MDKLTPTRVERERFMMTSREGEPKVRRTGGNLKPMRGIEARTSGRKAALIHTFSVI